MIKANWPLKHLTAFTTTREGGISESPYNNFNLAQHVNDSVDHVNNNRAHLKTLCKNKTILWLQQQHTINVIEEKLWHPDIIADGCYLHHSSKVAVALTADCLPIVIGHQSDNECCVLHAGWPGLSKGIIFSGFKLLKDNPENYYVWLGPHIGNQMFEVGEDVYTAFIDLNAEHSTGFKSLGQQKYLCDMVHIAKQQLANVGIKNVYGGEHCTYSDAQQFFSYRRDGVTGRMATVCYSS